MGVVSTFNFTSDTETVTRVKLNNLVANLLNEFNGNVDNDNIKSGAGILASKLDLASPGIIGSTTAAAATFTAINATSIALTDGTAPVPVGGIIMWSGTIGSMPTGWGLCDGSTYGTVVSPNLTDKFVIHADADSGGTRNVGDTGGSHTTDTEHTHSHTLAAPAHTHAAGSYVTEFMDIVTARGAAAPSYGSGATPVDDSSGGSDATVYDMNDVPITGSSGAASATALTGSIANAGSATTSTIPKFYALAYIIKHNG
jgi:hypothetical protein